MSNPPALTGAITVTNLTATSYTLTWPAGTDDIAVTGYEIALDGITYSLSTVAPVTTLDISGRTPLATDQVRIRAIDVEAQVSTPPLSTAVTLNNTTVVTVPLTNNAGSLLLGQSVYYSWFPGGRVGSLTGVTATDGTGTTDFVTGTLTVVGLPPGSGVLMVGIRGGAVDLDRPSYHALTAN